MADLQEDLKKYLTERPDPKTPPVVGQFLRSEKILTEDAAGKKTVAIDPLANQYMLTAAFSAGVTLAPEYKDDLKKLDKLYGDYQTHQKEAGKGIVSKVDFAKEISTVYQTMLNETAPEKLVFANQRLEAANEPGHSVLTISQYNKISGLMAKNKTDGLTPAEVKDLQSLLKKENPDLQVVSREEGEKKMKEIEKEKAKEKEDKKVEKDDKKKTSHNETDKVSDLGAQLANMIKEGHSPEALASKGSDLRQEIAIAQAGGNLGPANPGGINNQPVPSVSEVRSV